MPFQNVDIGITPNDGTGDFLRPAGLKINSNFEELYPSIPSSFTTLTNADSPVTLTTGDYGQCLEADTSSGNITINLIPASNSGYYYLIKKTSANNSLIISPDGSDTIDNVSGNLTISGLNEYVAIYSDGVSNWLKLSVSTSDLLKLVGRQGVLSTKNNISPDFITNTSYKAPYPFTSVGLQLTVEADGSNPLVYTIANGYNSSGAVDRLVSRTTNLSLNPQRALSEAYYILDVDQNDYITYLKPQRGSAFDNVKDGLEYSILRFEGADSSTNFEDGFRPLGVSRVWSVEGSAQIDTAQFKFGSSSGLFNGTNSVIHSNTFNSFTNSSPDCTVELQIRPGATGLKQTLLNINDGSNEYGLELYINSSNQIALRISTDGTSWGSELASTTTVSVNTWYHVALTCGYDSGVSGVVYKIFIDGQEEASVSASDIIDDANNVNIGATRNTGSSWKNHYEGHIDMFKYTNLEDVYASSNFSAPTDEYGEFKWQWFNTAEMKPYEGIPGNWSANQKLHAFTGLSSTTAINYGLVENLVGRDSISFDKTEFEYGGENGYTSSGSIFRLEYDTILKDSGNINNAIANFSTNSRVLLMEKGVYQVHMVELFSASNTAGFAIYDTLFTEVLDIVSSTGTGIDIVYTFSTDRSTLLEAFATSNTPTRNNSVAKLEIIKIA